MDQGGVGIMEFSIIVPKGTFVKTTHPDGDRKSKMNQEVSCIISRNDTTVIWAGSGGYWRWVLISDVIDVNPVLVEWLDNFGD